ncbi:hypothetical protein HYZ98_05270 [Candidatus Peregrinibacteria bacterium]|nr:hypothetical protein [Candidatus Peregrinibacteria bacterium]
MNRIPMLINRLSTRRYLHTTFWALLMSGVIVVGAALLGRATINIKGALIDKPDIAIYLLLPNEKIGTTTLLRETTNERHYLAETKDGPKLVILEQVNGKWEVKLVEKLRE